MKKVRQFFVYIDRIKGTDEIFYIGEGNLGRVKNIVNSRNKYWRNIVNKFGIDREIYCECVNKATALFIEERLIKKYHTFVDDPLCNKHACNFKSQGEEYFVSEEIRQKLRKPKSEMTRHNMGKARKGIPKTKEHCCKISETLKDIPHSKERRDVCGKAHMKPVEQLDKITGKVITSFDSLKEAAAKTGIKGSNICICCQGKIRSAGGFKWRYVDN